MAGLKDPHVLARDLRAAQPPDQLLTLAGKHRADDDFDPAHMPLTMSRSLSSKPVIRFQFSVSS